jgi:hypothetical protein
MISIERWMRDRELASDRRAGFYAGHRARRRRREYVRDLSWQAPVFLSLVLVLALVGLSRVPSDQIRWTGSGAALTAVVCLAVGTISSASGASHRLMGESAEQRTAEILRKRLPRSWHCINAVMLEHEDLDHVLIGPGGLVGIETKWTGWDWDLSSAGSNDVLQRGARSLARKTSLFRLFLRPAAGELPTRRLIVVWGPEIKPSPNAVEWLGDVEVVSGDDLPAVLDTLDNDAVDRERVERAVERTVEYIEQRDAYARAAEGRPPRRAMDVSDWFVTTLVAGLVGLALVLPIALVAQTWLALTISSVLAIAIFCLAAVRTRYLSGVLWSVAAGLGSGMAMLIGVALT